MITTVALQKIRPQVIDDNCNNMIRIYKIIRHIMEVMLVARDHHMATMLSNRGSTIITITEDTCLQMTASTFSPKCMVVIMVQIIKLTSAPTITIITIDFRQIMKVALGLRYHHLTWINT